MESAVEQTLEDVRAQPARPADWAAIRLKIECYLGAWRVPAESRQEALDEIMSCVERRLADDPHAEPNAVAVEEAEKIIGLRFDNALIKPLAEFERAFTPQRPIESSITTMETSLSRLPSFRIIAGWFLLIALLILGFLFTH